MLNVRATKSPPTLTRRHTLAFIACTVVMALSLVAGISIGGSHVGLSELAAAALGRLGAQDTALIHTVVLAIRLPRLIVACLCGAVLAAAGVVSQGLFRNPLADPSVLGTVSGGAAAAAFAFYWGGSLFLHWLTLPLAAVAGCFAVTALLLYGFRGVWSLETLLLVGFAVNSFLGALTSLVISLMLEQEDRAPAIMYWLLGGLSARGWEHVAMAAVPAVLGFALALSLCARLDVLALGEDVAHSLGVDTRLLQRSCIAAMALLIGASVSVAGAIPFVGLMVPHFTRLIAGPSHKRLLLLSAMNGVSLLVLADLVARTIRAPEELQVGVLTAMLGAPFFIWLLWTRRSL